MKKIENKKTNSFIEFVELNKATKYVKLPKWLKIGRRKKRLIENIIQRLFHS